MLKDPSLTPNVAKLLPVEYEIEEAIKVKEYYIDRRLFYEIMNEYSQLSDVAIKAYQEDIIVPSFVEPGKQAQRYKESFIDFNTWAIAYGVLQDELLEEMVVHMSEKALKK
ncbi:hypothetical protein R1flu_005386 [Riccia fluitans]|uniref:Uncharacterized protein n=1 Tax=Riccia fluitans TaxID=41844 RepID=A0ABD1YX08_9MARC